MIDDLRNLGDKVGRFPLSKDYVLLAGFDGGVFFLRLLNGRKVVYEWENKKNVCKVKSVEKDVIEKLLDWKIYDSKKKSKNIVSTAFKHFMPLLLTIESDNTIKRLKNNDTTDTSDTSDTTCRTNTKKVLRFFTSLVTTTKRPGIGFLNTPTNQEIYYFGQKIPIEIPILNKEGERTDTKTIPWLVLITNEKNCEIVDTKFLKKNNMQIKGELTIEKPRWTLEKIEDYTKLREQYSVKNPKEIYQQILQQFKKYIWFDQEIYYHIFALWTIGTYFFPIFTAYPYINLWGLKNSGKTKVMQLSSILSFNGTLAVNMSSASLFRIVEQDCPTLFIDEAETLWKDGAKDDDTSDMISMLNAGWMRGSSVPRVEKVMNELKIKRFDVYCPKMLASIKGLRGALESRCINIIMVKPKDKPESDLWPLEGDAVLTGLRDDFYPFALKYWKEVKKLSLDREEWMDDPNLRKENERHSSYPPEFFDGIIKEFKLSNRDWQMWKPLLCIAKLVSDDIYLEVGTWAEEECRKNSMDDITEDSWDSKVYEALLELVVSEIPVKYYVADIKRLVDQRFIERVFLDSGGNEIIVYSKSRPSNSFIGRLLNKVGFGKFRGRDTKRFYLLDKKRVQHILSNLNVVSDASSASVVSVDGNQSLLELSDNPDKTSGGSQAKADGQTQKVREVSKNNAELGNNPDKKSLETTKKIVPNQIVPNQKPTQKNSDFELAQQKFWQEFDKIAKTNKEKLVDHQTLINTLKSHFKDETICEAWIETTKNSGDIYEIRPGQLKRLE